jgi:hypothetical protein
MTDSARGPGVAAPPGAAGLAVLRALAVIEQAWVTAGAIDPSDRADRALLAVRVEIEALAAGRYRDRDQVQRRLAAFAELAVASAGAAAAPIVGRLVALQRAVDALAEHMAAGPTVAAFVENRCRRLEAACTELKILADAYAAWCQEQGIGRSALLSKVGLSARLAELGFERTHRNGVVAFRGLAVPDDHRLDRWARAAAAPADA